MHIRYRDKSTGAVTVAMFERHTMIQTMRRYPARRYEIIGGDFMGKTIQLVGAHRTPCDSMFGHLLD